MTTHKHTPGPWIYGSNTPVEIQILKDDTGTSNERMDDIDNIWVLAGVNSSMGDESRANAHLIAAAPELLQVLKDLIQVGDSIRHDSVIWIDIHDAVKLAEGGSE